MVAIIPSQEKMVALKTALTKQKQKIEVVNLPMDHLSTSVNMPMDLKILISLRLKQLQLKPWLPISQALTEKVSTKAA